MSGFHVIRCSDLTSTYEARLVPLLPEHEDAALHVDAELGPAAAPRLEQALPGYKHEKNWRHCDK